MGTLLAREHDKSGQTRVYDLQTRTWSIATLPPVPLKERIIRMSWPTAVEPMPMLKLTDTSVKLLTGRRSVVTIRELRTLSCISTNSRERNDEAPVALVRETSALSVYIISASYTAGSTWEMAPVDVDATRTLSPCAA